MTAPKDPTPQPDGERPLESTTELLARARGGDEAARERLFARHLPALTRWAHRRLPAGARDISETADLVQVTLIRALGRLDDFEPRGEGSFLAYLRQILLNAVRDEIRRASKRSAPETLDDSLADPAPSILEQAIGREALGRYEQALALLAPDDREAVILRVELGLSHAEIAAAMGKPSTDAARMCVARGLVRLSERMGPS